MAAAGIVDPTKAGRYPVVLSDALLGKKSGEVYTGVRCKRSSRLRSAAASCCLLLTPSRAR